MVTDILLSARRKRRKKFFLKAGLILLGILFLTGGIVSFFYVPRFRINEIAVGGANAADESELKTEIENILKRKILKFLPADNIFLLPKTKIAAFLLQSFPILKKADIERSFFQKISVSVEERKPAALLCFDSAATSTDLTSGPCLFMDENGILFQEAPSFSGEIFVKFIDERQATSSSENLAIGRETIPEPELRKLLSFEKSLAGQAMAVSKIILKDGGEYEVYLKEGWYIKLNNKNEADLSFGNLQLVLEETIKEKRSNLEYIDLRFGNKVFFKFK